MLTFSINKNKFRSSSEFPDNKIDELFREMCRKIKNDKWMYKNFYANYKDLFSRNNISVKRALLVLYEQYKIERNSELKEKKHSSAHFFSYSDEFGDDLSEKNAYLASTDLGPLEQCIQKEENCTSLLHAAMKKLEPDEYDLICQRFFKQRKITNAELGRMHNVSEAAIRKRTNKILEKLKVLIIHNNLTENS